MKEWKKKFQEIKKDPKGRAILFFGFYLLFFIAVILFVRLNSRERTLSSDYEKGNSLIGIVGVLSNSNYAYQYHIITDGHEELLEGKRYKTTDEFEYQNKSYYCHDGSCFVKEDSWIPTQHPFPLHFILEADAISEILNQSYYESKTSYESGQTLYHYVVTTDTLNQIIYNEITDLDLPKNTISVRVNEKQQLTTISLQLDSFCQYHKTCQERFIIDAEYSKLGEITEISSPIMD